MLFGICTVLACISLQQVCGGVQAYVPRVLKSHHMREYAQNMRYRIAQLLTAARSHASTIIIALPRWQIGRLTSGDKPSSSILNRSYGNLNSTGGITRSTLFFHAGSIFHQSFQLFKNLACTLTLQAHRFLNPKICTSENCQRTSDKMANVVLYRDYFGLVRLPYRAVIAAGVPSTSRIRNGKPGLAVFILAY